MCGVREVARVGHVWNRKPREMADKVSGTTNKKKKSELKISFLVPCLAEAWLDMIIMLWIPQP